MKSDTVNLPPPKKTTTKEVLDDSLEGHFRSINKIDRFQQV